MGLNSGVRRPSAQRGPEEIRATEGHDAKAAWPAQQGAGYFGAKARPCPARNRGQPRGWSFRAALAPEQQGDRHTRDAVVGKTPELGPTRPVTRVAGPNAADARIPWNVGSSVGSSSTSTVKPE